VNEGDGVEEEMIKVEAIGNRSRGRKKGGGLGQLMGIARV
jgi:hypothetical protein